ncbi:hypothetical protein MUO69_07360 [Candidatus Bathyarchaeota archaeon]|nr:hypothetical protein [Candidatus Bathyarchaeota archaeon]
MNWSFRNIAKTALAFYAILMLAGLVACGPLHASTGEEAFSRITSADDALKLAFKRVLEAEEAGANVSSLMSDLDEAGESLAEAEVAYRNGNLTGAAGLADSCSALAGTVSVEALALKDSALADSQQAFESTFIFSTGGVAVLVEVLILSWFWFKRARARKLLVMKCEVVSNAGA